ncbi:hypothetical protein [Actinopolyspora saharensis]|uniref:Uncharacterized protein n=1 Tax=Actinopolyspora saharensis TaxID=995062 RepID=A0A1H1GNX3_9ACTN|nr:hypothetical protein [Actinopolyspora saharensis]SDR14877.1 hypothetical protein SAMN04489718_3768 [Actinopolyspora saharensis]
MSQPRRRSTFARRLAFVGACACMLFMIVINRASVADSFTERFPWTGHWLTSVVFGVVAFALGAFSATREDNDAG